MDAQDSSDEDEVEKDVAYLMKNFRKFLKFKRMESLLRKENSQIPRRRKRISRRKMGRILNLLKQSRVMNATIMDISRRSVQTI